MPPAKSDKGSRRAMGARMRRLVLATTQRPAVVHDRLPESTATAGLSDQAAATQAEKSPAGLDASAIAQLRRLGSKRGQDVLARLARLFLDNAAQLTAALREAASRQDIQAVAQSAHVLKSASANLGALVLSRHCAAIERAARAGQIEQFDTLLREFEPVASAATHSVECLLTTEVRQPDTARPAVRPAVRRKHILIVDDDAAFRLATREVLESEGFDTNEAASGDQALAIIGDQQPDLILLDALMRGMDGFETCRRIRRHQRGQTLPLIMVTGLDDVSSVEQAFHAGATGFATKPASYPVLIQQMHFMLRASETESSLREHKAVLQAAQRVARLGYWRWDQATGLFELSENLREMCGIPQQDFPGTPEAFLRMIHGDDRARVDAHLRAAVSDRQLQAFDYRIQGQREQPLVVQQDLEHIPTANGFSLLGTVQDVTEQRRDEERIRRMAYFDALTGLASRSHLMQHVEDTIKIARRREEHFTILFLDLDGFKDVNDSLGHDVGDLMLVRIARRLQRVIRDVDFVARLGGDEFCILLDDNGDELDAAEVATRCLEIVNQPIDLARQRWRPQVSIGLARFPEDGDTAGLLLKAADSAMYAAKQNGKHRYAFYRPQMTEEAERRLRNEQLLREALEKGEFEIHYQPQIDLHSGQIVAVEALTRWRHPQLGLVMPGDFIPTLERIGLIRDLGNWVMRTACHQAMAWMAEGIPEMRIAVNISPLHFHDPGLLEAVQSALAAAALPAHLFEIEITESSVQSGSSALQVLRQLRALGIRISIDDFGTGYSSLGSLKHLPINSLKIDRVFVADMLDNDQDAVMLGTIVAMSHALGYAVVAEGVEQREQAAVLAALNCDHAQGYLFSRPLAAEQIPALIARGSFMPSELPVPSRPTAAGGRDA
ncbi:MAG: EAL domain-containing protein [Chromatiaceae bacterium]|nr:EAL domain-containing protein [Chromatiaceae bacterium]